MKRISKTRVVWIQAQELQVHPMAQRDLVPAKLKRLIQTMDLDSVGILHGVEYDIPGKGSHIWIIDGQHRHRALLELGMGDWEVQVVIHTDVTNEARASMLFLRLNDRAPVRTLDKFKAEVAAGVEDAVGALQVVQKRGLKVGVATTDGWIACVEALKKTWAKDQGATLGASLDTALSAWGMTLAAVEGSIVQGLAEVYGRYNGTMDRPSLIKRLSKFPGGPSGVLGERGRCVSSGAHRS